jgi:hypothetical protein
VIEAQGWDFGDAEFGAGRQPAVTRDYVQVAINQDRDIETEHSNAFGNLPDLPFAVNPCVGRVWFQIFDPTINNS